MIGEIPIQNEDWRSRSNTPTCHTGSLQYGMMLGEVGEKQTCEAVSEVVGSPKNSYGYSVQYALERTLGC